MPSALPFLRASVYSALLLSSLCVCPLQTDAQPHPASDPTNTGNWQPYAPLTDEFSGSVIDTDKWEPLTWTGRQPVYHDISKCQLVGGEAVMTTELRSGAVTPVTENTYAIDSGYMQSTHVLRYGYYEIRAKALDFPISTTWWLNGGSDTYRREIDMLECPSGVPGREYDYLYNRHIWVTPTPNGLDTTRIPSNPPQVDLPFRMIDDYHIYGFEWDKDSMKFYIDGVLEGSLSTDSFKVGIRMMLGCEYNNFFTNITHVNDALTAGKLPAEYKIDYVRTWLKPDTDVTWYVDGTNGDDANSGLSWIDAKKTINAAINETYNGDQIWVAQGVYREYQTIHGVSNLEIYGGFRPGDGALTDRDPKLYQTIIQAPVDGYNVFDIRNNDGFRLDGFIIQGTTKSWDYGLRIEGPSNNVVIANCQFSWNQIADSAGGGGAGVIGRLATAATFENCTFSNNKNTSGGAGLILYNDATVDLESCRFSENETTGPGSAIALLDSSQNADSIVRLTNTTVTNNTSGNGNAAVEIRYGTLEMLNSTVAGNNQIGVYIDDHATPRKALIENSLIAHNSSYGLRSDWSGFELRNNLFFGNSEQVQYVTPKNSAAEINAIANASGNVVGDPLLFNLTDNDVRLQSGSPAIDAALATNAPADDIEGIARPQGGADDIGAHEYLSAPVAQRAFGQANAQFPGRLNACSFDTGGEGVSYHDTVTINQSKYYRGNGPDTEWKFPEASPNVGWGSAGEWMEYTVDIKAGTYDMAVRLACPNDGKQIKFLLDGVELATVDVPNTGSWDVFQTVSLPDITLPGGNDQVLRVEMVHSGINYSWIEFYPTPLTQLDTIGTPAQTGAFSYDNGRYFMQASGLDLFNNTSDSFHAINQTLVGDGYIVAKIADISAPGIWAKSGIMFRESLAPGSKYVALVQRPGKQVAFYWRETTDANPVNPTGWAIGDTTNSKWLALARRGDEFRAYYSTDGTNWQLAAAPHTVSMASTLNLGLVATPLSTTSYNNTVFSDVSLGADPAAMVPATTDSDADQIPDDWEISHGTLPLSNDTAADPDGDRFTTWEEYVFGTHPNLASSFFSIAMDDVAEGFDISFPTVSGRNYRVMRTGNLAVTFTELTTVPGADDIVTVRDTTGTDQAYYTVEAELSE